MSGSNNARCCRATATGLFVTRLVFAPSILGCSREGSDVCRRHHIRTLSLFGSVLSENDRPASNVDLLVEFEPRKKPGLPGLAARGGQSRLRQPPSPRTGET